MLEVTPGDAGWSYTGLAVARLDHGVSRVERDPARETCVVMLSGRVTITAGSERFDLVGGRSSVFDAAPHAVYVPAGAALRIEAESGPAEVALCTAPGIKDARPPYLIPPERIGIEERGTGTNRRTVRHILPETAAADSLLVVEVITPGGHWSSYPPHKHDADELPDESALEEIYYHRLTPPHGFAFQRVYTDDGTLDESIAVCHGDAVLVPRGYHPVAAPPGQQLYYLNVMAGPKRVWRPRVHADFAF